MLSASTNDSKPNEFRQRDGDTKDVGQESPLSATLRDLHQLVESYAPQWYTYEHHKKGEVALERGGQEEAEALLMLYDLLEKYAPQWYTQEHAKKAEIALKHPKRGHELSEAISRVSQPWNL